MPKRNSSEPLSHLEILHVLANWTSTCAWFKESVFGQSILWAQVPCEKGSKKEPEAKNVLCSDCYIIRCAETAFVENMAPRNRNVSHYNHKLSKSLWPYMSLFALIWWKNPVCQLLCATQAFSQDEVSQDVSACGGIWETGLVQECPVDLHLARQVDQLCRQMLRKGLASDQVQKLALER